MTKKKQSTEISKKVEDLKQYDLNVKNYVDYLDKKLTLPPDCVRAEYHTSVMIDNIEFTIRIKKQKISKFIDSPPKQVFYLYIQNKSRYLNEKSDYPSYDVLGEGVDNLETLIKDHVLKVVNTFKYCKISNKLTTEEEINFLKLEQELFNGEWKCCVCYDYCTTKSKCNHNICLQCLEKIKSKDCPVCRTCLCCGGNGCDDY